MKVLFFALVVILVVASAEPSKEDAPARNGRYLLLVSGDVLDRELSIVIPRNQVVLTRDSSIVVERVVPVTGVRREVVVSSVV